MSDHNLKPVLDELTLNRLLEAAYVLQEHNRELHRRELSLQLQSDHLREQDQAGQVSQTGVTAALEKPSPDDEDYTLVLAQILETQRQIQLHHLAPDDAMALVTKHVMKITDANGSAIAIVDSKQVRYRASSGACAEPLASVPLEKALCNSCIQTGQVMRSADVNSEFLVDAEECRRRGIASLIAVPIYHQGGIAGALELYFARAQAFREQDVHTCQLMAGLVTEVLAPSEKPESETSFPADRDAMLETLNKLKPGLAALSETLAPKPSATLESPPVSQPFICRKCGHELVGEEQFCGKCGSPRSADYDAASLQSKVALMWEREQAGKHDAADSSRLDSAPLEPFVPDFEDPESAETGLASPIPMPDLRARIPAGAAPRFSINDPEFTEIQAESSEQSEDDDTPAQEAITRSQSGLTWSSAAAARDFLEQLSAQREQSGLARLWHSRRGDVYLAIAVILVAVALRWTTSEHPVSAGGAATHQKRVAPNADLSLFDKVLIKVGLAEAPDPPENTGNPETQVWVDLHTALYYCPGTDLYGKTPKGKFTTQRDAQLDQFEPAYRKACN